MPAALERCGRLSDGWLPSLCTPDEAAAGRVVIDKAAAEAGRSISGEHFGMSIGYAREAIDPATARTMAARRPRSLELTPVGLPALSFSSSSASSPWAFRSSSCARWSRRPPGAPSCQALAAAVGDLQT